MSLLQRRWYFGKVPYSDKPELSAATEAAFYFSCFASAGLNTFEMAPRSGWWWWRRWGWLIKPLTYIQIRLQDQVGYDDMVIFADVMAMVIWWASQTVRWWHLQLKALCLPINSVDFQTQSSQPRAILSKQFTYFVKLPLAAGAGACHPKKILFKYIQAFIFTNTFMFRFGNLLARL